MHVSAFCQNLNSECLGMFQYSGLLFTKVYSTNLEKIKKGFIKFYIIYTEYLYFTIIGKTTRPLYINTVSSPSYRVESRITFIFIFQLLFINDGCIDNLSLLSKIHFKTIFYKTKLITYLLILE